MRLKIVALVCLTVIACTSIVSMAYLAGRTTRNVAGPGVFMLILVVMVAVLGGMGVAHRGGTWKVGGDEDEDDEL